MKVKLFLVSTLVLLVAEWIGLSLHPMFQKWSSEKLGNYHAHMALVCFNKINDDNVAIGSYWNNEKRIVNLDVQILNNSSVRLAYAQAVRCILDKVPEARRISILDTYFVGFFNTMSNSPGYELRIYAYMAFYDRQSAEAYAGDYMDNDVWSSLRNSGHVEWMDVYQAEQFGFAPQLPMQSQLDLHLVKVALQRAIKHGYIQ